MTGSCEGCGNYYKNHRDDKCDTSYDSKSCYTSRHKIEDSCKTDGPCRTDFPCSRELRCEDLKKCCKKPCVCPSNYTKLASYLFFGVSGGGSPIGEDYFLNVCKGELYQRFGGGWQLTSLPHAGERLYFYDQCKVIWVLKRSKCGDSTKTYRLSDHHCDGDVFINSENKEWYVLKKCEWTLKMTVGTNSEWSNSTRIEDWNQTTTPSYGQYDGMETSGNLSYSLSSSGSVYGFRPNRPGVYKFDMMLNITGSQELEERKTKTLSLFNGPIAVVQLYFNTIGQYSVDTVFAQQKLRTTTDERGVPVHIPVTITGIYNFHSNVSPTDAFSLIGFTNEPDSTIDIVLESFNFIRISDEIPFPGPAFAKTTPTTNDPKTSFNALAPVTAAPVAPVTTPVLVTTPVTPAGPQINATFTKVDS